MWSVSRELAEEFSELGSLVTASCARLRTIHSARECCSEDSLESQCGTTCDRSTADLGIACAMSSLPVSPANPLALQGNDSENTTLGTCGQRLCESFATFDLESRSWRTSPDLFGRTFPVSSETWPSSGSLANGECWERGALDSTIDVAACGSMLPTPTVGDSRNSRNSTANDGKGSTGHSGNTLCDIERMADYSKPSPTFREWMMGWPIGHTDLEQSETECAL